MLYLRHRSFRFLSLTILLVLFLASLAAQQTTGILRGVVTDESGALIPAARLTVSGPGGFRRNVQSQADGVYTLVGLAPGKYTVRLTVPGFAPFQQQVEVAAGRTIAVDISLHVQAEKQQVTVTGEPGTQVSVDPDNNAGALILRGDDLDALSDDPDDLAAELQALAGPSAGPNGGQIFIDGFSGGSLPPKANIREIRINQNPFSAEYDQLGYGRIEILTRPGTDRFRGSFSMYAGDNIFNARNPYVPVKPDFTSRTYDAYISGPVTKKSSFSFNLEKRDTDDAVPVNAQLLDDNFNVVQQSFSVPTPTTRNNYSGRLDYALSKNNTLVGRYTYMRNGTDNAGVRDFSLPTRGYNTRMTESRVQLTETSILNAKTVNETRFQWLRMNRGEFGDNTIPAINVNEAFMGGGAQIGRSSDLDTRWEIQNYTTTTRKAHTLRFGVRIRPENEISTSVSNFGGTFSYGGGIGPILNAGNQPAVDPAVCANVLAGNIPAGCQQIDSLERYRRTRIFLAQGLTVAQLRPLGGGPTLFTIAGGTPRTGVLQTDLGAFIQDDWRVRPNFTLSLGFRYETQTNIHDNKDFAPRLGFAWAPGGRGGRSAKTVIRGGSGFFYSRFDNSLTLNTIRLNGINQQNYNVVNPNFVTVPSLSSIAQNLVPSSKTIVDSQLNTPLIWQAAIGIERQLPKNTTIATTFTFSHGTHMFRSRDINAPILPGGPRPYGPVGDIFEYEASGLYNQRQWMTNVNSRVNRKISLFGYYTLNFAKSNTDGVGSFPANQYDLSSEYGRSALDSRQRIFIGGNVTAPLGLRFSPSISARTGSPFNVTTGRDFYGDTKYTDRPSLAAPGTPGAIATPWGVFNPNPALNDPRIPRNFAEAPGYFTVNMRMSRTFGFGAPRAGLRASGPSPADGGDGGDRGLGGDRGPGGDRGSRGSGGDRGGRGGGGSSRGGGPGGGRGGPGGGGMRMGGGGMRGGGDGSSSEHRYSLTLSVSAHNLFNHLNPGAPTGNLTSPYFGIATNLASTFGPAGGAANRRIDLSMRLSF